MAGTGQWVCLLQVGSDVQPSVSEASPRAIFCRSDLTNGVRASANAVLAMEQGLKQSAQLAHVGFKQMLVPGVKSRIPAARGAHLSQHRH